MPKIDMKKKSNQHLACQTFNQSASSTENWNSAANLTARQKILPKSATNWHPDQKKKKNSNLQPFDIQWTKNSLNQHLASQTLNQLASSAQNTPQISNQLVSSAKKYF